MDNKVYVLIDEIIEPHVFQNIDDVDEYIIGEWCEYYPITDLKIKNDECVSCTLKQIFYLPESTLLGSYSLYEKEIR